MWWVVVCTVHVSWTLILPVGLVWGRREKKRHRLYCVHWHPHYTERFSAEEKYGWPPCFQNKLSSCLLIHLMHNNVFFFSLYLVFQQYSKYSKVDVAKAIDLELKGDIENCLIAVGETLKPSWLSIAVHISWNGMTCNNVTANFSVNGLRWTIPFKTWIT